MNATRLVNLLAVLCIYPFLFHTVGRAYEGIAPFAFNAISCSSPYYGKSIGTDIICTEEPHDARTVSFACNTVCTIEHDFIGGFAPSTNRLMEKREKYHYPLSKVTN